MVRYPPKSLVKPLAFYLCVIRPTEVYIASILGLESAVEELRYRLFPGVFHPFTSEQYSRSMKRDTELHLGQRVGLADYRDIQVAFSRAHKDPEGIPFPATDVVEDLQRGHGSKTSLNNYARRADELRGTRTEAVQSYRRCSMWWHHITGKPTPLLFSTRLIVSVPRD